MSLLFDTLDEMEVAFISWLNLFITSIIGLLLIQKVITPVRNIQLLLYACICLKSEQNIDVIVLGKSFI